ncbi:aspartate/glutamate racemase family protein [Pseudotabrizicola algicola]|uniref:Amino acid racemase n=1 Tax=Pseudotabrizicola algicola TaxID=2709381 RepID=A0A6B3RR17_9RHOB|nr:amino acid racemase [Pseudotabrizicola algicola]NEX46425.1 amino acid racemase [Pseudotabrizicola algicola]
MKTVGILGGMGPEATVLLMQRLLQAVPAQDDADHIPLVVHQNPAVPSRIARLIHGNGPDPGPVLAQMARDLQAAGAEALAMPCNTAHAYVQQIRSATPLPFLDMRAATMERLGKGRVGMLASPALRLSGAIDTMFVSAGIEPVWPEDEGPTLALIRRVKAGQRGREEFTQMARLAQEMVPRCNHLLVACTELSLLTAAIEAEFTDSLDCLIAEILRFSQA